MQLDPRSNKESKFVCICITSYSTVRVLSSFIQYFSYTIKMVIKQFFKWLLKQKTKCDPNGF